MSKLRLEGGPRDKSGKRLVIATYDQFEHRDRFDTDSAFLRRKFCEACEAKFGCNGDEQIEERIIQLADAEDSREEQPEKRKTPRKKTPTVAGDPSTPNLREPAGRTDHANARRFAAAFGDDVHWCEPWKRWLVWDGRRWKIDQERRAESLAKRVADFVWREVGAVVSTLGGAEQTELLRFAKATSSERGINSMLALARSEEGIAVLPDDVDADGFLLNCLNGTLDLRTGELREHDRADLLTKLCPTAYRPEAESKTWKRFLSAIFNSDDDIIGFERRFFGYCLTDDQREQILAIYHGTGANGKSTLINAKMKVVGPDYTMQAPRGFLMASKQERHLTEQHDLRGRRFVAAVETGDGRKLDEELVKSLTGGESIRARKLYADHEQFTPTHKLVIATNHKPRVRGQDHAIWRRIALVPFDVQFWNPDAGESGPDELRQDKTLPEALAAEAEGILAWAVRGCLEWQESGLRIPPAVRAATESYRTDSDVIGRFVAECCIEAHAKTSFKSLYDAMEQWCNETGENRPSRKMFAAWLDDHGFEREKSRYRAYRGIALQGDDCDVCDDATDF